MCRRLHIPTQLVLGVAVAAMLALEALRGSATLGTSTAWPLAQALVGVLALVFAWRRQEELTLPLLLVLGLVLHSGWIAVHLARGVDADYDASVAYLDQGNALLDGTYPSSEYPPGAVVLFAFEALVGGGSVRVSHALAMVPFQLAVVAAVWLLRTRSSRWFAAVLALWPLNAFFWEFKFDLVPTAFLVFGLVFASRERWLLAGALLGVGAATKWAPALTVLALVLWLLASRRWRAAAAHAAGAGAAFLVINIPFLVWSARDVLNAYTFQAQRGLIGESLAYIPLRLLGRAHLNGEFWDPAQVPDWANGAAIAVQTVALVASLVIVATRGRNTAAAVATAAMVPVVFLIFNRVFSPQFLVLMTAAWAVAGSLLARNARAQLVLGALVFGATLSNVLVYPTLSSSWGVFSAFLFLFAFAATGWVYALASRARLETASAGRGIEQHVTRPECAS
jgi:hypothetical protein